MIVIYTPRVTNRIKYVADFVFRHHFGISYELNDNPDFIILSENLYINYSNQKIEGCFSVFQDELLLQEDIQKQKIFISLENELPVFFQTKDDYHLKFDIFSCIFFLLSRYEEYLPHEKDVHGRYRASNSILVNPLINFSPIVEYWIEMFKREMLKIKSDLVFKKYEFEYLPTFDIDNAYQYRGRNWLKNPPNIFSKQCRNVFLKKEEDAYDTFDFILEELEKNNLKSLFFFLMNDEKQNSNVSPASKLLHSKIAMLSAMQIETGIHPSYFASEENNLIQSEKLILEFVKQSTITASRQHFLKINFPLYYRKLIEAGIKIDYSLAYPDMPGFRAGYSRTFFFFDLEKNENTSLLLQPSCWMDATFEYYQQINILEIQQFFLVLFNQLKKINGKLVTIFHNDLLAKEAFKDIFTFINQQITNEK